MYMILVTLYDFLPLIFSLKCSKFAQDLVTQYKFTNTMLIHNYQSMPDSGYWKTLFSVNMHDIECCIALHQGKSFIIYSRNNSLVIGGLKSIQQYYMSEFYRTLRLQKNG